MEHMPKPLLRRLALTLLVGAGCLFTGSVFFLHERDASFLILSILLSAGSLGSNANHSGSSLDTDHLQIP